MTDGERIVARARACIGARFRPHGRSIAHGLDCVGVAAIAFDCPAPGAYPLRGGGLPTIARSAAAAGLAAIDPDGIAPGDLVAIDPGAGQLHLIVTTPGGFVHADAGLRRVVEVPGVPAGTIIAAWRREGS